MPAEDGDGDLGIPGKTLLLSAWAFGTIWWSIFTPPERTFAARILLFQPFWIIRILNKDVTWRQDLFLVLALHAAYSVIVGDWTVPSIGYFQAIDYGHNTLRIYAQVFSLLAACGVLAGAIVHRGSQIEEAPVPGRYREKTIDEYLLPPLLIPSRTTHTRLFPKKHSFGYSYFFVGVPVGMTGRISNALSIDGVPPAWFDVRAADYLNRGGEHMTLAEKLKSYLHVQGVTDRDYSFAYLVTAPRFLGYSFNPVSFWYIYDADARLKYMILEVNNTFDERRLYLLRPSDGKDDIADELDLDGEEVTPKKATTFTDTWEKDFHVSPFNSRKGSYSVRALDPLASYSRPEDVKFDNTIVLRSSKDHPKIIARVFSTAPPTSALTISTIRLTHFILSWWWVGLITFPRILYQATLLFFRRNLHVWFRPEIVPTSIGRPYTVDEKALEHFFRSFLTHVVETSSRPLRVIYHPAHPEEEEEIVLYSPNATYEESQTHTLTLKVLTPAFYSRFIHYAHVSEAFDRESLATDEKNRTVVVECAHLLPILLESIKTQQSLTSQNPLDRLRWRLLRALRCPPAAPAYPSTNSTATSDIRTLPLSPLDTYVQHQNRRNSAIYRRISTKLFLAQRSTLGLPPLITALDWLLRSLLILATVWCARRCDVFDVLRPKDHGVEEWREACVLVGLANGMHFWEWVKG